MEPERPDAGAISALAANKQARVESCRRRPSTGPGPGWSSWCSAVFSVTDDGRPRRWHRRGHPDPPRSAANRLHQSLARGACAHGHRRRRRGPRRNVARARRTNAASYVERAYVDGRDDVHVEVEHDGSPRSSWSRATTRERGRLAGSTILGLRPVRAMLRRALRQHRARARVVLELARTRCTRSPARLEPVRYYTLLDDVPGDARRPGSPPWASSTTCTISPTARRR